MSERSCISGTRARPVPAAQDSAISSQSLTRQTHLGTSVPGGTDLGEDAAGARVPGLVLVFCAGQPAAAALSLLGAPVEIGRDHPIFAASPDPRMSRRHAQVACEDGHFQVSDLDSRNGTVVD